jgi:hypothetical protein
MTRTLQFLIVAVALSASTFCVAEDKPAGFLCCNMRTDGAWIKVTGYGHYRVKVDINGKSQAIGNDYSRDLALDAFAKRYVVADDPAGKIAAYPKKI